MDRCPETCAEEEGRAVRGRKLLRLTQAKMSREKQTDEKGIRRKINLNEWKLIKIRAKFKAAKKANNKPIV